VMTSVQDEEYRSRAYALGVDLFWLKPDTHKNMHMFLECLESLLGRETAGGFRGVQSKSLMDIIQMECLSQTSTVLRITRGALIGKIWILDGELIDAEAEGACGEMAFRRILEWKSGTFENLPAAPDHPRNINKSVNALLLETAQAMDETAGAAEEGSPEESVAHRKTVWRLSVMTRESAEWVVALPASGIPEGWGMQTTEELGKWMGQVAEATRRLSDRLETGPLDHIEVSNLERRIIYLPEKDKAFLVAWAPDADPALSAEKTKQLVASWES
jgi:hypothetical protein